MSERSKPRKLKSSSPPPPPPLPHPNHHNALPLIPLMARKSSLFKQTLITAVLFSLGLYAFFNIFASPSMIDSTVAFTTLSSVRGRLESFQNLQGKSKTVKVYMYDLPRKFTYGVIEQHSVARGGLEAPVTDVSSLRYPGHQHMAEWFLFKDFLSAESERGGSPVIKVEDPEEADLFYVPFFSSLSLIVNPSRSAAGSGSEYKDEEMQDALIEWLEDQEYWTRNNGWDHVFVAQDPNALYRVVDRIRNAVLLVSDFGRLQRNQASLVKDVIVPYSHRINAYNGDVGVANRNTLLFFMGNRYRKEGGKIRDLLFQALDLEKDVITKHGAQSRESRRLATLGMHSSKFCLHPAGDTPSACRLFDAIVSLCVPVIVSDNIELPFEDVIDYRKIAIFVESASAIKPGFLVSILKTVTSDRILEYQNELKEVKRYFMYDDPNGTVNEIWRQVLQKLPLIKLMINRDKRLILRELTEPDCSCLCSNHTGPITIL